MKNCQQFELYAAEDELPVIGEFDSVAEVQEFYDALRERPWWAERYSNVRRVEAFPCPGRGSVGAWFPDTGIGHVELAANHLDRWSVTHELCHVLAAARYGSQAHCPWFARTYLEVTYEAHGSQAFVALLNAFDTHGIDHKTQEVEA